MVDLEKLTTIAKIKLTEEEIEDLKYEISKILEYFEKIQSLDTEGYEYEPISYSKSIYREEKEPKKFEEELIIINFPEKEGKKLEVPRLL